MSSLEFSSRKMKSRTDTDLLESKTQKVVSFLCVDLVTTFVPGGTFTDTMNQWSVVLSLTLLGP